MTSSTIIGSSLINDFKAYSIKERAERNFHRINQTIINRYKNPETPFDIFINHECEDIYTEHIRPVISNNWDILSEDLTRGMEFGIWVKIKEKKTVE